MNSAKQS